MPLPFSIKEKVTVEKTIFSMLLPLLYQRKSKQRKRKENLKENKTDPTSENETATTFLVLEYSSIKFSMIFSSQNILNVIKYKGIIYIIIYGKKIPATIYTHILYTQGLKYAIDMGEVWISVKRDFYIIA